MSALQRNTTTGRRLRIGIVLLFSSALLGFALLSLAARPEDNVFAYMSDSAPAQTSLRTTSTISPCSVPNGTLIDAMESIGDWHVMKGSRAISATFSTGPGYSGQALRLNYSLSTTTSVTDNWVQFRRDFNPPLDLSAGDHLRFFHKGTTTNTIEIGLVSVADENYFGSSWNEAAHVPTWRPATWDLADFRKDGRRLTDTHQIKAIFISVARTADGVGGVGSFTVDELQYLKIATRTVPPDFEWVTVPVTITQKAAAWVATRQQLGGLLKSWQEEPADFAWQYDQALGLIVLSQTDLSRAGQLAARLHELQNTDGSWYIGYHYTIHAPIETKKDIGPIAWTVYALMRYFLRSGNLTAYQDAREGARWLSSQQASDGSLSAITEWNLDTWWAFQSTGYQAQADRLRDFLLNQVWDDSMGRFKSSSNSYHVFLDNQTWGAAFLYALGRDADARRASSYAQWTLATRSFDGSICGFDGAGPFSVWNEGTLQYIAMGGENSPYYWDQVVGQQAPDGGLPNSPDSFRGYIVWLSPWHGVAPTAWLYFVGAGEPFRVMHRVFLPVIRR